MNITQADITRTIQQQILNLLSNKPNGYLITSGNLIADLELNTENKIYDDFVFRALSNIKCDNLLFEFNRKLIRVGYESKFSRNGKRPAALYKLGEL